MTPNQVLSILARRIWIILLTFASILAGAGSLLWVIPPRYDATATAIIDPGQLDPITGQATAGMLIRLVQGNLIALATSDRVALEVVKRLNLVNNPGLAAAYVRSDAAGHTDIAEWIASDLLRNIDAKFAEGTNVLTLKYKSGSPLLATAVVNSFSAAFMDAALAMKINIAQQTAQWFQPQTDKLRQDLDAAREKLTQYQLETNLLAPASGGGDTDNRPLAAVTGELSDMRNQLLSIESSLGATAGDQITGTFDSQVTDTSVLTQLKGRLASLNAEMGSVQKQFGDANPKVTALIAQRKGLEEQIHAEIAKSREQLMLREKALKSQIETLEKARADRVQEMIALQAKRDHLDALRQEVEWRQELLHRITSGENSARLQSQLSFSNITTLDKATPPVSPSFPKMMIVIPSGAGAGLVLGIIFALLAEAFDRRIRAHSDLEFAASVPVLGTLMKSSSRRRRFLTRRSRLLPVTTARRPLASGAAADNVTLVPTGGDAA